MTHLIEVHARPGLRLGMEPLLFLRDYWQKRSLLIRGAYAGWQAPLAPEDLAGLACEEAVLARLIQRDANAEQWNVRIGPFVETDFTSLPHEHWTVLVQDVDKWDADVAALLDDFDFLPRWRMDDVMISYAADGGGVGAHVDQYDVFLLQGLGKRRWRIDANPDAPKDFRDDVELKILSHFQPSHEWTLEPGDMLYLPPGVPHDGTAVGPCMTFSIGMRAPSLAEMIVDLAESVAEPLGEEARYVDPDLAPPADAYEIDAHALARVGRALAPLRDMDEEALGAWFGRYITRYRAAQTASPPRRKLHAADLDTAQLHRHPFTRFAYARAARGATLYAAGDAYACSIKFAQHLCAERSVTRADLGELTARDAAALLALANDGHLVVQKQRKARR